MQVNEIDINNDKIENQEIELENSNTIIRYEENVIESISVNGVEQEVDENKNVDITVPTKISDLDNDNNTVQDENYVHTDNNYTNSDKNKLASLENYDDAEIKADIQALDNSKVDKIQGKGLSTNDYTNEEKNKLAELENYDDTEITEDIEEMQTDIDNLKDGVLDLDRDKADKTELPDVSDFITKDVNDLTNYTKSGDMTNAINTAVGIEATARQNADNNLQNQIDAITSASDVVDVVGTYTELQNYDTTKLTDKDLIKVLQDSTHNNALSYYRWVSNVWSYVGSEGPFYTKGEADTLYNAKQNTIDSSHKLQSDLVDDTNQTNKFTTANEKETWNGKYNKPNGGIPKTDLASDVQTSLGKADSAIQDTDYATDGKGGTIKTNWNTGTYLPNGQISARKVAYTDYSSLSDNFFISKGTLENVIEGKELVNETDLNEASNELVITGQADGIAPTLEDSANYSFKNVDLGGNTEQKSYTGKNKLAYPSFSSVIFGNITFANNKGIYTISTNGTSTSPTSTDDYEIENYTIQEGDYIHYNNSFADSHIGFTLVCSDNTRIFNSFANATNRIISLSSYVGKTITKVCFNWNTGYTFNGTCKPMITNSSTATDFEEYVGGTASPNPDYPQEVEVVSGDVDVKVANGTDSTAEGYEEQTITLPLPTGMELCKIGDYQDKIFKNTKNSAMYNSSLIEGAWYKYKAIGKVVLDGSENWYKANENINVYVTNLASKIDRLEGNRDNFYCNYFKYLGDAQFVVLGNCISFNISNAYRNSCYIQCDTSIAQSNTELKNYVKELYDNQTPIIIYYVLATQTYEQITDTDFIEQAENMVKMKSYKDITYVSSDNEPSPYFDITFLKDTILGNNNGEIYDELDKKLGDIETLLGGI